MLVLLPSLLTKKQVDPRAIHELFIYGSAQTHDSTASTVSANVPPLRQTFNDIGKSQNDVVPKRQPLFRQAPRPLDGLTDTQPAMALTTAGSRLGAAAEPGRTSRRQGCRSGNRRQTHRGPAWNAQTSKKAHRQSSFRRRTCSISADRLPPRREVCSSRFIRSSPAGGATAAQQGQVRDQVAPVRVFRHGIL